MPVMQPKCCADDDSTAAETALLLNLSMKRVSQTAPAARLSDQQHQVHTGTTLVLCSNGKI